MPPDMERPHFWWAEWCSCAGRVARYRPFLCLAAHPPGSPDPAKELVYATRGERPRSLEGITCRGGRK